MIITLALIGFGAVLFAVVYFPYRRPINAWFARKGYKENRNLVAAAVVAAIVVAIVVVFNFTQRSASSSEDDLNAAALAQLQKYSLEVGSPLPPIVLPDTEGQEVNLGQFQDQALVLSFWSTGCKYCARQLPELKKLEEESASQVRVFLINMNEDADAVKKYKADQKIGFDILVDETGQVSNLFKIQGTPMNFFVNQGVICASVPGAMDKDAIVAALQECILVPASTAAD